MAGRLGRRVVHFANLPIKLLMPKTFNNIEEIALKTVPSASKIEIKRVLESVYGFEVDKVRTLNMEGKKKKRGGLLIAKPDYKKAYVTLKNPLSISPDLYPLRIIEEEKERVNKQRRASSIVDDGERKRHWLDDKKKKEERLGNEKRSWREGFGFNGEKRNANAKFPWSSMRTSSCHLCLYGRFLPTPDVLHPTVGFLTQRHVANKNETCLCVTNPTIEYNTLV